MAVLYLHIGTPKTATTALQIFCESNQESLQKQGYCYPMLPYQYPKIERRRNAHFLIGKRFLGDTEERDLAQEQAEWDEGIHTICDLFQKYQNIILSDEGIWYTVAYNRDSRWKQLQEIAKEHCFQVKIIVYLRRQDTFADSTWNQRIKSAANGRYAAEKWDAEQIQKSVALNYYKHLEKVSEVFGKENVIVRVFEREQFQGAQKTIQSDFLETIGVAYTDDFITEQPVANERLRGNSHEIKRVLNSLPDFDKTTKGFVDEAIRICSDLSDPKHKYSMFSERELRDFLEKYRASNVSVAKEYLGRENGVLFLQEAVPLPKWTPDNPYLHEDFIRYFGEATLLQQKTIAELQRNITALEGKYQELQKKQTALQERISRISGKLKHPVRALGDMWKK